MTICLTPKDTVRFSAIQFRCQDFATFLICYMAHYLPLQAVRKGSVLLTPPVQLPQDTCYVSSRILKGNNQYKSALAFTKGNYSAKAENLYGSEMPSPYQLQ